MKKKHWVYLKWAACGLAVLSFLVGWYFESNLGAIFGLLLLFLAFRILWRMEKFFPEDTE
jgi:uncharacterized membrane protein YfcA